MNPKNFISKLYQNDTFLNIKKQYEEDIIDYTKKEVERKDMLKEADSYLAELSNWRKNRKSKEDELRELEEISQNIGLTRKATQEIDETNAELEQYQREYEERMKPQLEQMEALKEQKSKNDHIQYHNKLKKDIDSYLQAKNQQVEYVQARLQGGNLSSTLDKQIKDVFATPKLEQSKKIVEEDRVRHEEMLEKFHQFEEDLDQFDKELTEYAQDGTAPYDSYDKNKIYGVSRQGGKLEVGQMVPGSMEGMIQEKQPAARDIDALLKQLKEEGEQYMNERKSGDGIDVEKMMSEINDEFDELDNLLKEVEELKVSHAEQELPESL